MSRVLVHGHGQDLMPVGDVWGDRSMQDAALIVAAVNDYDRHQQLDRYAWALVDALPYEPGSQIGGLIALVRSALQEPTPNEQ